MKESGKILNKILIVVIGLAIILGSGFFIFRHWVFSKMSLDEKAHYHEWSSKPLHFNPADIESLPFRKETETSAKMFREEWERIEKSAIKTANEYGKYIKGEDEESTKTISLDEELQNLDPLIEAFIRLIEQEDYEIDALIAGEDPKDMYMISVPNFLQFRTPIKILGLKASQLINEGRYSEASSLAETMIRASKAHPYSTIISQMIAIAGHSMGTETWHYVITRCDDAELLRSALLRQNELVPEKGFLPPDIDLMVSDNIGSIRKARKFGISSDIDGKTGKEIMAEWFRVEAEYQENILLPGISDPAKIDRLKKSISGLRKSSAMFGGDVTDFRILKSRMSSFIICPFLFRISRPNHNAARTREKAALAKYDLLRLYTAKKLYLLEHQKEPENMEDLVPEYIPELLLDPFTEKEPFRKESFFYSIGPDGKDQKGAIFYDPTNGTVTLGDIFLERVK